MAEKKSAHGESRPERQDKPAEKPVSLHPLKFEEAVRDLLRVKPEKANDAGSAKARGD